MSHLLVLGIRGSIELRDRRMDLAQPQGLRGIHSPLRA